MSDHLNLDKFYEFISFLRKTIADIDKLVVIRDSKLNFSKMLYCLGLKVGAGISYAKVCAQLEGYGINDVTRQAICERRKSIPSSYLKELNDNLICFIHKNIKGKKFVAFDGSKINLPLKASYYTKNPNGPYKTAMIGSMYDITNHVVINYTVSKSHNERQILLSQLDHLSPGDVAICDRGYFSKELVWNFIKRNLNFVLRLQDSLKLVNDFIETGKDDTIIDYELTNMATIKLRMVKYTKDKEIYYIATSLIDNNEYSLIDLQNIYTLRWDSETDLRYSKSNLSLGYLMSQSRNSVEQDVYVHQFIGIIECVIRLTCFNNQDGKNKMNTSNCYDIIIDQLLRRILLKRQTKKVRRKLNRWIKSITGSITEIKKNRHYKREVKRPKQHMLTDYRKAKEKAIEKANMKSKEKANKKAKKKTKKKSRKNIIRMRKQHQQYKKLINDINKYVNDGCNYIFIVKMTTTDHG